MKVYMLVTNDEYEYPIHICDSIYTLAKICNVTTTTILSAYRRYRDRYDEWEAKGCIGKMPRCRYQIVNIGELENDNETIK